MNQLQRAFISLGARGVLNWMPDSIFLKGCYRIRTSKKLNLKTPTTFNEKLQWLKINDRNPMYSDLVDKFKVRAYIEKELGEDYLIPLLGGPWKSFDEIDFNSLPDEFVLKCTHDSGGLVVCRDKSKFDLEKANEKIEKCLKRNYFYSSREWPYKNVEPAIIAEKYMEDENSADGLTDYKFFCFNQKPEMLYVSQGLQDHSTASISFYDLKGNEMPFHRNDYKPINGNITLPEKFEEMTVIAEKLAKMVNNPFVRVDLYSIYDKIYFSEITFYPCSGMIPFEPEEWDEKLGSWIELPNKK